MDSIYLQQSRFNDLSCNSVNGVVELMTDCDWWKLCQVSVSAGWVLACTHVKLTRTLRYLILVSGHVIFLNENEYDWLFVRKNWN